MSYQLLSNGCPLAKCQNNLIAAELFAGHLLYQSCGIVVLGYIDFFLIQDTTSAWNIQHIEVGIGIEILKICGRQLPFFRDFGGIFGKFCLRDDLVVFDSHDDVFCRSSKFATKRSLK